MIFAGLDLSGYKKNERTVLVFNFSKNIEIFKNLSDEEIINLVLSKKDVILSIDAPLSFPRKEFFRYSDKNLKDFLEKNGFGYLKKFVLPPLLSSMKILTERGIRIKNSLKNIKVIETHPTISIFLILFENNFPVKDFLKYKRDYEIFKKLCKILEKILEYELDFEIPDELDAFICSYISFLFYKNEEILYLSKTKTPFVIYNPEEKLICKNTVY